MEADTTIDQGRKAEIAGAFISKLRAEARASDEASYTKAAEPLEEEMPEKAPIEIVTTESADLRSYHVTSTKIAEKLSYTPKRTLEDAARDVCRALREGKLPNSMSDDRYFNVNAVKKQELQ